MNIYFAGISGTGLGPLAIMAANAGFHVTGSDRAEGAITGELRDNGIKFNIGEQDGAYLKELSDLNGIDWFVYTSALPADHPELKLARNLGIKCTKRDEFTAFLIEKLGLKMIAVAGTHGKTTTTSMCVWACQKLGIPAAYLVGTTLGFAPSASYKKGDQYFIYEADEYDRNFLHYHPWLGLITFVSYDHPDIYPTQEDYTRAFEQFESQCENLIFADPSATPDSLDTLSKQAPEVIDSVNPGIKLPGLVRRKDATTVLHAMKRMTDADEKRIIDILNEYPGVGRRFEKLADGIYTDYAHHPEEVKATLNTAAEEARITGKKGVVLIYQPHQNVRQHEVKDLYKDAFLQADKIYWLPTYLVREDPDLPVLTPEDLISILSNKEVAEPAEIGDELRDKILSLRNEGYLVILMTAGPADTWLRSIFL